MQRVLLIIVSSVLGIAFTPLFVGLIFAGQLFLTSIGAGAIGIDFRIFGASVLVVLLEEIAKAVVVFIPRMNAWFLLSFGLSLTAFEVFIPMARDFKDHGIAFATIFALPNLSIHCLGLMSVHLSRIGGSRYLIFVVVALGICGHIFWNAMRNTIIAESIILPLSVFFLYLFCLLFLLRHRHVFRSLEAEKVSG